MLSKLTLHLKIIYNIFKGIVQLGLCFVVFAVYVKAGAYFAVYAAPYLGYDVLAIVGAYFVITLALAVGIPLYMWEYRLQKRKLEEKRK